MYIFQGYFLSVSVTLHMNYVSFVFMYAMYSLQFCFVAVYIQYERTLVWKKPTQEGGPCRRGKLHQFDLYLTLDSR